MGQVKKQMHELESFHSLDFDLDEYDEVTAIERRDWWKHQDAELTAEELDHIETEAEIQELRTQGYVD